MIKSDIKFYNDVTINGDIEFIKYLCSLREINLVKGTGILGLLDECQEFLQLGLNDEIFNATLKPLLILHSFSDTLKILWMKRQEFGIQLSAMNTGSYDFGIIEEDKNNFKDFEFELFSAAYLNECGLNAELPQHTVGNDILYKDIEIQCKHPETFTRDKIDKFLRAFQSSLQKSQKYGVLGLGLDDFMAFKEESFSIDSPQFEKNYQESLIEYDKILRNVLDDTLRFCPRVLGIYSINTHFVYNEFKFLSLSKTSNGVFCLRPNAKRVHEEIHRQAYEVISVFNPKPAIRIL